MGSGWPGRASIMAVTIGVGGCALEAREPAAPSRDEPLGVSRVPLDEGTSAELDVALAPIACTASMSCRDSMMADPSTGRRGPTLLTGLECVYDPSFGPPQRDVMLAMHRRLTCYDAGDPATPASWQPPEGYVIDPIEESYSAITSAYGDAFLNTATLLSPLSTHAFCRYEAWAVMRTAALEGALRTAEYRPGAAVGHWAALLVPSDDGSFACGLEPGGASATRLGYATAAAFGRPDPEPRGAYPATYESAIFLEIERQSDRPEHALGVFHALRMITSAGAPFPITIDSEVAGFEERLLWVEDPATGAAADPRLTLGCVLEDEEAGLDAVALALEDRWSHVSLGAILVERGDAGVLDCARARPGGACELLRGAEIGELAPCLTAMLYEP